jgi:hypothetical protein
MWYVDEAVFGTAKINRLRSFAQLSEGDSLESKPDSW